MLIFIEEFDGKINLVCVFSFEFFCSFVVFDSLLLGVIMDV